MSVKQNTKFSKYYKDDKIDVKNVIVLIRYLEDET